MDLILESLDEIFVSTVGKSGALTQKELKSLVSDKAKLYKYIESVASKLPAPYQEIYESVATQISEYITEAELINNGQALAAVVAFYPAIAELYQEPRLYKLAIPFKTDNGKLQVNLIKRIAKILEGDNVLAETEVPKPVDLYQNIYKQLEFNVNTADNIFAKAGLTGTGYKVILTKTAAVSLVWNDGTSDQTVNFVAYVRSDKTIQKRIDLGADIGYIDLYIKIDDRTGDITVTATPKAANNSVTIDPKTVTIKTIITNVDSKSGYRVVFDEKIETVDRYVEPGIPYEAIADIWKKVEYQGQYNIDYLRDLAQAIKAQLALLKDYEIVEEMKINENGFSANLTVDFNNMPASMNPSNPADYLSFIVPALIKARNIVFSETLLEPTYIAVNPKNAEIIESLINSVALQSNPSSKLGISASDVMSIQKFTVLKSNYVPENKIYLIAQGNRNNPGIVDAILGAPIVKTVEEGTQTKVMVFPNSTIVFIDPKKMASIQILNAPSFTV
jgi:hypothetical protein